LLCYERPSGGHSTKIIIDSREQTPFKFSDAVKVETGTLQTGDYSLQGLEHLCAVERKSLPDFIACCGKERDRFKRELQRLKAYRCRAVIIEGTLSQIMGKQYRSAIKPASVIGSTCSWMTRYQTPFLFAENAAGGALLCESVMRTFLAQLEQITAAVQSQKGTA